MSRAMGSFPMLPLRVYRSAGDLDSAGRPRCIDKARALTDETLYYRLPVDPLGRLKRRRRHRGSDGFRMFVPQSSVPAFPLAISLSFWHATIRTRHEVEDRQARRRAAPRSGRHDIRGSSAPNHAWRTASDSPPYDIEHPDHFADVLPGVSLSRSDDHSCAPEVWRRLTGGGRVPVPMLGAGLSCELRQTIDPTGAGRAVHEDSLLPAEAPCSNSPCHASGPEDSAGSRLSGKFESLKGRLP